jgi:hypothetical protein
MALANRARVIPLHPERGALSGTPEGEAERNHSTHWESAVANTANVASATTFNYTKALLPFLNDEIPASKESKMSDMTREEMKAEIAASEARGETKIARFEGKLDLVLEKLGNVNENVRSSNNNQWVIGLGLAVLIVAMVALFPVFFGMGAQIRDMVHTEMQSQTPVAPTPKPQK